MPLTRKKIDYICDRARQILGRHEPALKPFFLVYQTGNMKEALEQAQQKLTRNKPGKLLYSFLEKIEEPPPLFPGLVIYTPLPLLSLVDHEQILFPILINTDELDDVGAIQHHIYHVFWHALNLLEKYKNAHKASETEDYIQEQAVIRPKYGEGFQQARQNLSADIFSVFMTEFEQKSGFIRKLALRRADSVMEKMPGFLAENYPYPLVMDVCQMAFDDLEATFQEPDHMFPAAYKMAAEITDIYGDDIIRQWRDFTLPAQEMIWLATPADTVLGYAVFTAEDPHVRTAAYMIAEVTEHTVMPSLEKKHYNAYGQDGKNRQIHMAACEESFHRVLSRAASMSDPSAFMEEVKRQNKRLIEGDPVGWCAHAIAEAGKTFEQCLQNDQITIEDVSETLHKHLKQIDWNDILQVSRTVITLRRSNKPFSLNDIADALWHLDGAETVIRTLRTSARSEFFEVNVSHVQRHKTMKSPIHLGFGPGAQPQAQNQENEETA
ncbi:MAG: hypothetical protein LRY54_03560 [Alphaproteobacteria bacterium]|nr:hypothetical protein [Alphaproteobacteria bacterium]